MSEKIFAVIANVIFFLKRNRIKNTEQNPVTVFRPPSSFVILFRCRIPLLLPYGINLHDECKFFSVIDSFMPVLEQWRIGWK